MRERQKHSISADHEQSGNRTHDPCNERTTEKCEVRTGEIDLEKTQLHVATNKILSNCILARHRDNRGDEETAKRVAELRKAGENPPATIERHVSRVLNCSDSQLFQLFKRIEVSDGTG